MRVIDLRKVSIATKGWENEFGMRCTALPPVPTYLGVPMHEKRSLSQADHWRFYVTFEFGSRRTETFYGNRAHSLWSAWCARIFGNEKPGNNKRQRQKPQSTPQLQLI
jgi:hypothetical protein